MFLNNEELENQIKKIIPSKYKDIDVKYNSIILFLLLIQFMLINCITNKIIHTKSNYMNLLNISIIFLIISLFIAILSYINKCIDNKFNNINIDEIIKYMNDNNFKYIKNNLKSSENINNMIIEFVFFGLIMANVVEIICKINLEDSSIFLMVIPGFLIYQIIVIQEMKTNLTDINYYVYNLIYDKYNEKKEEQQKHNLHRLNRKRVR